MLKTAAARLKTAIHAALEADQWQTVQTLLYFLLVNTTLAISQQFQQQSLLS